MTAPISQTAFRGPGDNLVGGVLAHLRLADRLPLRVSCRCLAHWDDPALDQVYFDPEVDLGTCGDLAAATTLARKAVASGSGQNMGVMRGVFCLRRSADHRELRPL